jgi:hypothetical protein
LAKDLDCPVCKNPVSWEEGCATLGKTFMKTKFREVRKKEIKLRVNPLLKRARQVVHQVKVVNECRKRFSRPGSGEKEKDELMNNIEILTNLTLLPLDKEGVCPSESCEGVLGEDGKCLFCKCYVCKTCSAKVESGTVHVCDESNIQSNSEIKKNCKTCFGCGSPCYKENGCNVMWCIKCHCFWEWSTGKLLDSNGRTPHNPDHQQFVNKDNRHRREVEDIPCGGLPSRVSPDTPFRGIMMILNISQNVMSTQQLRLKKFAPKRRDLASEYKLALKVAKGTLSEQAFVSSIERTEQKNRFREEIDTILETYSHCATFVAQRIASGERNDNYFLEVSTLKDLTNETLASVSSAFGMKGPRLNDSFQWS